MCFTGDDIVRSPPNGSTESFTEAGFYRVGGATGTPAVLHLPRSLHVDGDDVEAVAAELAGPGAALADPLQQAVLVGVTH